MNPCNKESTKNFSYHLSICKAPLFAPIKFLSNCKHGTHITLLTLSSPCDLDTRLCIDGTTADEDGQNSHHFFEIFSHYNLSRNISNPDVHGIQLLPNNNLPTAHYHFELLWLHQNLRID